jgi:glycosyltransferase involved in cell wall biosynthesis
VKRSDTTRSTYLSIIIPVYNEEESIPFLHERIHNVLAKQDFSYEILYVDDGSTDDTFTQLKNLVQTDEHVRILRFRRNFGQTAAMSAGVDQCCGEIIVFMDGDLQNDPIDIPRLLAKIEEGYDVVSGWRKNRQDAQWSRKFPSLIANKLISKVTKVHLHDYGCTLKAYRYEVFQHIRLYGEMHRFIPVYASLVGAKITELEVTHHARQFGKSKYGISRTVRVILDLLTIKFLSSFSTKPLYAFGTCGLSFMSLGLTTGIYNLGRYLIPGYQRAQRTSIFPLTLLFTGLGLLSMILGLIAELLIRTYYESQNKPTYIMRHMLPEQTTDLTGTMPRTVSEKPESKKLRDQDSRHLNNQRNTPVA